MSLFRNLTFFEIFSSKARNILMVSGLHLVTYLTLLGEISSTSATSKKNFIIMQSINLEIRVILIVHNLLKLSLKINLSISTNI